MEEIWKPIDQFPNYNVSNLGNIKNIITNKLLKLNCKDGYCNISLKNNEIKIVMEIPAFIGCAVNHLNLLAFNMRSKIMVSGEMKNKAQIGAVCNCTND
jgi:hypothetical protein